MSDEKPKAKRRGSLPLKVRIPGCQPIRRLSGTHDRKMRDRLTRMVHTLHEQGRDDLVNAIAAGRLTPLEVYNRFKFQRLDELPHADELPRFRATWPKWLADLECSDEHRRTTELYFKRLEKLVPEDASVGGAVDALKEMRIKLRAHPRSFNLCRSNVMAYLRDTVGRRHRYWNDAADVPKLKQKAVRAKHPLTPDRLRDLVKAMGEPCGPMAWTMATTGMGWKEYLGAWEREGDGLRIHGTKTGGRDRLIPLVSLLHPPVGVLYAFRQALHKASGGTVTPYDLRRTFMTLMVEAGVPRPRRRAYMGHAAEDISALYEFQEVREYLLKDAARIRAFLGEPEAGPALQMVRA